MSEATMNREASAVITRAGAMVSGGEIRAAIDLLTHANRDRPSADLERELVRLRRLGGQAVPRAMSAEPAPVGAATPDGTILEVAPGDLNAAVLREGFSRCGCLLVRGLVSPERAARLAAGIDAALAAFDAYVAGDAKADPAWFSPESMPDRVGSGMTEDAHRRFLRGRGALWTADSPRMLFELFEFVDDLGLGALMTEFLGERPLMSGIKGTLRRVPPDVEVDGRWHQDGAFLGERIAALNIWVTLTRCGVDAPGLDIVPKRFEHVVQDAQAKYDWSLSDEAVLEASAGTPIVRPELEAGDALLFDHLLLHRTGASPGMIHERHAIESWFFAPSAYPLDQLPILC